MAVAGYSHRFNYGVTADQAAAIRTCAEYCARRDHRDLNIRAGRRDLLRSEPVASGEISAA